MKIEFGKPIKVDGEKWIVGDATFEEGDGLASLTLKLHPRQRPLPPYISQAKKRWTIYVYNEGEKDPVTQSVEDMISQIDYTQVHLAQLRDTRTLIVKDVMQLGDDIKSLKMQLDRMQHSLRQRIGNSDGQ